MEPQQLWVSNAVVIWLSCAAEQIPMWKSLHSLEQNTWILEGALCYLIQVDLQKKNPFIIHLRKHKLIFFMFTNKGWQKTLKCSLLICRITVFLSSAQLPSSDHMHVSAATRQTELAVTWLSLSSETNSPSSRGLWRQLRVMSSTKIGMFHPGSTTMPSRLEHHSKHTLLKLSYEEHGARWGMQAVIISPATSWA